MHSSEIVLALSPAYYLRNVMPFCAACPALLMALPLKKFVRIPNAVAAPSFATVKVGFGSSMTAASWLTWR
jgi:hypothetical protein